MADHVLSIEFSGDFSKLRTQVEAERAAAQAKMGTVGVGGSTATTPANVPGASPQAQQAVNAALDRADQRRQARGVDDRELSPVLRSSRFDRDEGRRFAETGARTDASELRRARTSAERAEIRALQARDRAAVQEEREVRTASAGGGGGDVPVVISPSDTDGGPPVIGGRRHIGSQRFGGPRDANLISRFASAFSAAYVARQAVRAVGAELELSRDLTLAGRNQDQQLAAILKHNEAVAPLGEIGQTFAEGLKSAYYGRDVSRLGTTLTARSATQTDDRSQIILENKLRIAGVKTAADIAGTSNEFEKARAQAEFQSTVSAGEINRRRAVEGDRIDSEIDTDRAGLELSRERRALEYRNRYGNTGRFGTSRNISDIEAGLRIEDESGLTAMRKGRFDVADAQTTAEIEANDRLRRASLKGADRAELAQNIRLESQIRSNNFTGRNDAFGAQLNAIVSESAANVSETSDPVRARKIFLEGYTRTFSFLAQTGRDLRNATADAEASTRETQAILGGDPLSAARIAGDAALKKSLRSLPDNFIFNKLLGGDALRKSLTDESAAGTELRTRQISSQLQSEYDNYQTSADVARLNAENKPLTGRAAGIAESAQAKARELARAGGFWNMQNRKLLLQTAQDDLKALENQIAYGGGVQVVEPGSTGTRAAFESDPGNTDATEALQRIGDESEKTRRILELATLMSPLIGLGY